MNPQLQALQDNGCYEAQGFGGNANPTYSGIGLLGHPGIDEHCGYGTPIKALASGKVFSLYPVDHPASDGYTAIMTLCSTPLEDFEFLYGHVSEIDVQIGDVVNAGDVIGKEGNHGPIYSGNRLITLAEQAAGNHEGSHRHYQKRPVLKTRKLNGVALNNGQGVNPDAYGFYYQVYAPNNGYAGCVDWTVPLFNRNLFVGASGYDVFLLQRALVLEGYATFTPTGNFGPMTLAAVISYQKANNLPATGYCGLLTRARLNWRYSQLS